MRRVLTRDPRSPPQIDLVHARARRRLARGIKRKGTHLLKKLRKAKKDCGPYDKPDVVKTHLRDMLIMPEMIGSVIGVHNGKVFTSVEVKADMVRKPHRQPAARPAAALRHPSLRACARWGGR